MVGFAVLCLAFALHLVCNGFLLLVMRNKHNDSRRRNVNDLKASILVIPVIRYVSLCFALLALLLVCVGMLRCLGLVRVCFALLFLMCWAVKTSITTAVDVTSTN